MVCMKSLRSNETHFLWQAKSADADRPTSEAESDRATASEIYLDVESAYYIFIRARGRTHAFTANGLHHTSFRTTQRNRLAHQESGKWERIEREELPDMFK